MKKVLLATAAVAFAAPAFAQNTVEIPVGGELARDCTIGAFVNDVNDLDMTSLAESNADSISVNCNYGGTASVELASANNGVLTGPENIGYTISVSGGLASGVQLTSPLDITNWPATLNSDQTRSLRVTLLQVATIAGTYADTITATVSPN